MVSKLFTSLFFVILCLHPLSSVYMLFDFQVEYMCLRISFTNLFLKDVHINKKITRILNSVAMYCSNKNQSINVFILSKQLYRCI